MANQIHKNTTSVISVDNLLLSNKAGTGGCVLAAPSGQSYQLTGVRVGYANPASNYEIGLHEGGYIWTNTGNPNCVITLPSGAPGGFSETFLMTGGQMHISPNPAGKFFHTSSGNFRPLGQTMILQSSGARLSVFADGLGGWYPSYEYGTIS